MAGYKDIGRSNSSFVALVFSHDLLSFLLFLLFPFIPISLSSSFLCSTGQDYQTLQFPFSSFYISILWTEPRASHLLDKCYALQLLIFSEFILRWDLSCLGYHWIPYPPIRSGSHWSGEVSTLPFYPGSFRVSDRGSILGSTEGLHCRLSQTCSMINHLFKIELIH